MYYSAVPTFDVHMGLAPQYVCDLLTRTPAQYGLNNYVLPCVGIGLYKTSFAFAGSSVWNSLPPKMKTYRSVHGFTINLRKIFYKKMK